MVVPFREHEYHPAQYFGRVVERVSTLPAVVTWACSPGNQLFLHTLGVVGHGLAQRIAAVKAAFNQRLPNLIV